MRRALQPAGRVAFVCWRGMAENDWMRLPMDAIKGIVPPTAPPNPEAPGPFSFGDRGRVARILTAAGFTNIAISPFHTSKFHKIDSATFRPVSGRSTSDSNGLSHAWNRT